jgi:predicted ATPase
MSDHVSVRKLGGRWLGVVLAAIVLAVGAAWLATFLSRQGLDVAARSSEVASFILALAVVLLPAAGRVVRWLPAPRLKDEQIDSDVADLAAALRIQGRFEGSLAGMYLYDRLPMPVRWKAVAELAPASQESASAGVVGQAESPTGTFDEVLEYFRQLPESRLVVLGPAGAGKTVLVTELTRRLLAARQPGDPVPVVIPATAWDPRQTTLFDWVAEQLIRINVDLADRVRDGRRVITRAQVLVDRMRVLPILDGIDEVADASRPMATVAVNRYGWSQPLVVTCRTDEYRRMIGSEHGTPVARAAVVELAPLNLVDIKDYLGPDWDGHWAALYGRLDAEPRGALAGALSNPLMLWLTWAVYSSPGRSPAELADRRRFASAAAVEHHLLAEFVPAVYPHSGERALGGLRRLLPARPAPLRSLGFLASDTYLHRNTPGRNDRRPLDRFETRDLQNVAWWRFTRAARGFRVLGNAIRFTVLWVVAWKLTIVVLQHYGSWRDGRYADHIQFRRIFLSGPLGRAIWPTVRQLILLVPGGTRQPAYSTVTGIARDIFTLPALVLYAVVFVMIWFFSSAALVSRPSHLEVRPRLPISLLTSCLSSVIVVAGIMWLVMANWHHSNLVVPFFSQRSTWFTVLAISLALAVPGWPRKLAAETDVVGTVNPAESLRQDEWAAFIVSSSRHAIVAVVVALFCGSELALAYIAFAVVCTGVALLLGGGTGFASRQFTDASIWLAVTRRMPWRSMRFLTDAERRGVFQEVGAIFRFRHARLQLQLQDWYEVYRPRPQDWRLKYLRLIDRLEAQTGDRTVSLAGAEDRVDGLRRLAAENLAEFGPDLATALSDQAELLRDLGQRDEELEALSQLVTTRRRLAEADAEASPALAGALGLFADRLTVVRRNDEAIGLMIEAAEIDLNLARADPDTYLSGLKDSVASLLNITVKLNHLDRATCEVKSIIDGYRELVRAEFDRNRTKYLKSLTPLVELLSQSGREDDAAADINYAVERYAKLPRTGPSSDPVGCEKSLVELAGMLKRLHRWDDACRAIGYSADIYRELAKLEPVRYRPVLVESLIRLAALYQERNRPAELGVVREAISVYRDAAAEGRQCDPSKEGILFNAPGLSLTELSFLALRLWKFGALQEVTEAAEIAKKIDGKAGQNYRATALLRAWVEPRLTARSTALERPVPDSMVRRLERLLTANETWEIDRAQNWKSRADAHDTRAFTLRLAGGNQQAESAEAAHCCERLVGIYRHLAKTKPADYLSDLAGSLDLLAIQLRKADRSETEAGIKATDVASEAQLIRQRLGPDRGR